MYDTTKAGLLSQLEKRELQHNDASILAKRDVRFEYLPPKNKNKKQVGKTCTFSLPFSAT